MTSNDSSIKLKVVLLGDASVGKTSIALRYVKNRFADTYSSTIAGSFCSRSLYISNKKVIFQLWDTAGTERFRSIVPFYLRDADVALITYDITEKSSFENLQEWIRLLQERGPDNIKCAVVGNKSDLNEKRRVTIQEARRFADATNLYFLETSAKTGDNIQKLFFDIGSTFTEKSVSRANSVVQETTENSTVKKSVTRPTSVVQITRENSIMTSGSFKDTPKTGCCS